jgi:hypothetical protein
MKLLSYGMRALMGLLAAFLFYNGRAVIGIAVTAQLAVSLPLASRKLFLLFPSRNANQWETFMVAILFANSLSAALGFWSDPQWSWLDTPMHFLGGVGAGWFASLAFPERGNGLKRFLLGLGMVAFIGVVWELFEWNANLFLGNRSGVSFQGDLNDTMKDLVMDLLGGIVFLLIAEGRDKNMKKRMM